MTSNLEVVTLGESMVLLAPLQTGPLRQVRQFERHLAGAESNLAIGLARLGHRAGWISRLGEDEFGQFILAAIRDEGVDVSQVQFDAGAPTGIYFKEILSRDQTRVYYYRAGSAASRLAPTDLNADYLCQARYLHLTGITPALSASCRAAVQHALDLARANGLRVSFDPNLRPALWKGADPRPVLNDLAAQAHLLIANEAEAALMAGTQDLEAAGPALLALGPKLVVIKLGEKGAVAFAANTRLEQPAMPVEVVDTVGAGDAFAAGLLAGQLRGASLAESLRIAAVAGALATTVRGDMEGLPTWDDVQQHLSRQPQANPGA